MGNTPDPCIGSAKRKNLDKIINMDFSSLIIIALALTGGSIAIFGIVEGIVKSLAIMAALCAVAVFLIAGGLL